MRARACARVGTYVCCRFCFQVMSIIVFGVVADKMEENDVDVRLCYFDSDGHTQACDTAVAVGIISMLLSGLYGMVHFAEFKRSKTFSFTGSQSMMIGRVAVSGFIIFLWLIAFGVMVHDWNSSTYNTSYNQHGGPARAAIAFAFLCFLAWVSYSLQMVMGCGSGHATAIILSACGDVEFGKVQRIRHLSNLKRLTVIVKLV